MSMEKKKILNFAELTRFARPGRDFLIEHRNGTSGLVIMAPHGGRIEPGTATIAGTIAGKEHAYYAFKGNRPKNNRSLHISSTRFDEPHALEMIQCCHTVITVHGCRDSGRLVYLGGRDENLKKQISDRLSQYGFQSNATPDIALRGVHPDNLCNRGSRRKGLQLEISTKLRHELAGIKHSGRLNPTAQLKSFALAVRQALEDHFSHLLSH